MTTAIWPTELPQYQFLGLSVSLGSNVIAFQVGNGPEKRRPRSTKATDVHSTTIEITGEQLEILQTFYRDTLMGGSLPFVWNHFNTGEEQTFRFKKDAPPAFKLDIPADLPENRIYSGTITLETV